MKYYQLTKNLPTFEKGEIFYIDLNGSLMSNKDPHVIAYAKSTLTKFPNILGEWFVEVPAPERDRKTKHAFMKYISDHKDERFMQAVRNFIGVPFLVATSMPPRDGEDTFYWECDKILKEDDDGGEEEEE